MADPIFYKVFIRISEGTCSLQDRVIALQNRGAIAFVVTSTDGSAGTGSEAFTNKDIGKVMTIPGADQKINQTLYDALVDPNGEPVMIYLYAGAFIER